MCARIGPTTRALTAALVLALTGAAASADVPAEATPGAGWRDAFPLAEELDLRGILGIGAGGTVRHWAEAAYPGIGRRAGATGGGAGIRGHALWSRPELAPFRLGLGAELVGLTTSGRTHDGRVATVGPAPGRYRFESDQCWFLLGGAARLVAPQSRVHLELDAGCGLAWLRTDSRLVWSPPSASPTLGVDRRGRSDATLAAGRLGLELGLRLTSRRALTPADRFHLGLRLRIDAWGTIGRARLRLDGDALASAYLTPAFASLSVGLTAVF